MVYSNKTVNLKRRFIRINPFCQHYITVEPNQSLYNLLESLLEKSYMASEAAAPTRHHSALSVNSAFAAGAECSVAPRSKCAAAFLSSAAERGPASQASSCPQHHSPHLVTFKSVRRRPHHPRRQRLLSPSSFHHSGLATSSHATRDSMRNAHVVAFAQPSEPTG